MLEGNLNTSPQFNCSMCRDLLLQITDDMNAKWPEMMPEFSKMRYENCIVCKMNFNLM